MTTTTRTMADLAAELRDYRLAYPPGYPHAEQAEDAAYAGAAVCAACGQDGFVVRPCYRRNPRSFRLLFVCRACGSVEEA